uniref:Uncharacterized protein n=1 Tax=Oryza sativa subsp. japonica TaxID=39947 RepID=Q6Z476_ORYSJ|nr:hypothetical protein [Oryza sativa Japonica Group]
MGINTSPSRRRGDKPQNQDQHRLIQANTRQDKSSDIDIRVKPRQTQYGVCGGQQERSSAIFDLAEYGFEEEDYAVVDYELVI